MEFIKNFTTSHQVYLFLEKQISQLKNSNYNEQKIYIENLPLEERILLINLMYIGRGDSDENDFYKNNFHQGYKWSYEQWKNDKFLVQQMIGKAPFINYLETALIKYSSNFNLG